MKSSRPSLGTKSASIPSQAIRASAPAMVVATRVESKSISLATTQALSSGHQIVGAVPASAKSREQEGVGLAHWPCQSARGQADSPVGCSKRGRPATSCCQDCKRGVEVGLVIRTLVIVIGKARTIVEPPADRMPLQSQMAK